MTKKIVLIDDESAIRLLIRDSLESIAGYEVIGEGSDGAEALKLYKELHPDVLIMDALMPGVDGMQGLEDIIAYDAKAKVVMVSAFEQAECRQEFLKLGASDCISKPFDIQKLVDTLEKIM